jgi:hypothetical protein
VRSFGPGTSLPAGRGRAFVWAHRLRALERFAGLRLGSRAQRLRHGEVLEAQILVNEAELEAGGTTTDEDGAVAKCYRIVTA